MRAYERSHRWLTFNMDLASRVEPATWMLLGEARSKCEHIAGVPMKPEVAARLLTVFMAKGIQGTTAIEGNTLSQEQVEALVEGKAVDVPPSKAYQVQEVENVLAALNSVVLPELVNGTLAALTPARICQFNALVLSGLKLEEGVVPGVLREHSVGVMQYRGAPAEDCGYLLDRLCEWLAGPAFDTSGQPGEMAVPIAILKAILAHLYVEWIHPFGDGNGRTGRLVEVQILATAGLPHVACHVLSNHYNQTRSEYYRQLDRASKSGGDVIPFINYALRGLVDGLTEQLATVKKQQWDVAWHEHVYERFKSRRGDADRRMRDLVLELSRREAPVPKGEISNLSPSLAVAYSRKTEKTLSRDLNALEEQGLIERDERGYRACKEIILAFLPVRHRANGEEGSGATPAPRSV
jgi:Fic family protein